MLIFIQGLKRTDISLAIHQCARFFNYLQCVHDHDVRYIAKYPVRTSKYTNLPDVKWWLYARRIFYRTNKEKGIECYVDANFTSGRAQADSNNSENSMSCTGYVIAYAGCTLLWCSKLQTEITLSKTEAEYIELSQLMRNLIPFMALTKEISIILHFHLPNLELFFKSLNINKVTLLWHH